MLVDDSVIADESGAFAKATISGERGTGETHLLSSHPREEPKTLEGVDPPTAPKPLTETPDRPTSPDRALPQHPCGQVVREDDRGAEPVASPPSAAIPPFPEESEARIPALEQEEWEVSRIVGRRRVGKVVEYKVRWKNTWLSRSNLGNARELLQEFEAQRRAQRGNQRRYMGG